MFATVRNRLGVIASVSHADSREGGRTHLVHVEYKDDLEPAHERLLWELEPYAVCQHSQQLPDPSKAPMDSADFDAVLRAARWGALTPYLDPDGDGPLERLPICAPLMGAVKVEDFQLVPLHKALAMPRVSLLLADDVGLGKTIEAGLIVSELISRRRINRVLILTPASLRDQWQEEMHEKFSLRFEVVDRDSTQRLRKEVGIDANPWRVHDRVIASYHYLKQPDILELFLSASRMPETSARLPWDLVIIDECHNTMPSAFGDDSDLCRAIRDVLPLCEHRLFLSATPHNGHTRCFTGLLEMLDPVRFTRSSELTATAQTRIKQVMVRRLKRTIDESSKVRRFCRRLPPKSINLEFAKTEASLFSAFERFREAVHSAIRREGRTRQLAGAFAVELLGKRLISAPYAFADSWWRSREAFAETGVASDSDVQQAGKSAGEDLASDAELEAREAVASKVVGAWLKNLGGAVEGELSEIDRVLLELGLSSQRSAEGHLAQPLNDCKLAAITSLIDSLLRSPGGWHDGERLIIFTEFKTTLDYLLRRLRDHYRDDGRFLSLFGGMNDAERRAVKDAFNDPAAQVRVLVATDAASEGLNLQQTARYMLHADCPWNPMRLEQRIGRLDRHGQSRDVEVFHFTSDQSADLRFLSRVIEKVDQVREDLGSCAEVFDAGVRRRLIEGETLERVSKDLDTTVDHARKLCHVEADTASTLPTDPTALLSRALDLHPVALRETLDSSMAWGGAGRPQLERVTRPGAAPNTWRVRREDLPGWRDPIDFSVRASSRHYAKGPLRDLAFGPDAFLQPIGGIEVFKPRPDTVFVHLAHPLMKHGIQRLTRARYPGLQDGVSRWTVRRSPLPAGLEAVLLLSVEELGVNALRETFHHWVRTVAFPVHSGKIGAPLPEQPASEWQRDLHPPTASDRDHAEDLVSSLQRNLMQWIGEYRTSLEQDLEQQLLTDRAEAIEEARQRFQSRSGELSELIQNNSAKRLESELDSLRGDLLTPFLFDNFNQTLETMIRDKETELKRRNDHLEEMRTALERERVRMMERVLPKRFSLGSPLAVFPVSLEIRFPATP
jgi:superfamily II DNA or RNA helicase